MKSSRVNVKLPKQPSSKVIPNVKFGAIAPKGPLTKGALKMTQPPLKRGSLNLMKPFNKDRTVPENLKTLKTFFPESPLNNGSLRKMIPGSRALPPNVAKVSPKIAKKV